MPDNYKENQDKFKARVGDRVTILYRARDHEAGWGTTWSSHMDRTVGQTGTVINIKEDVGIAIKPDNEPNCCFGRGFWWYPYFVLSLVR
jgi:hypothetical protein